MEAKPLALTLAVCALLSAAPAAASKVTLQLGADAPSGSALKRNKSFEVDGDKLRHDDVVVAKGETVEGDVVTSGSIKVLGTVEGSCVSLGAGVQVVGAVDGDVVAMGGPIEVSGRVGGDVAALGGDARLLKGASIGGDLALVGGKLSKEPGVKVGGSVTQMDWSVIKAAAPFVLRGARALAKDPARVEAVERTAGWASFLAVRAALGLVIVLLAAFLGREIRSMSASIAEDFWRSAGAGTLIVLMIVPGLVALTISILGIPLIPLGLIALAAAATAGVSAFSVTLAERVWASFEKPAPKAPVAAAAGWALLCVLPLAAKALESAGVGFAAGILSFAGFLLAFCGGVAGLGAAWRTRLGRRAA